MDLKEILKDLNIPFREAGEHHHATPGWVSVDCPFCGKDSERFRLGINLESGGASCWTCGVHKLSEVLAEAASLPLPKVWALLKGWERGDATPREVLRGKLELPKGLGPLLPVHLEYLEGRGFDPLEVVKLWGVQGLGIAPRLQWRLFIPIHHFRGEVVSWTTRKICEENPSPRYINSPPQSEKLSPKAVLYGEGLARHAIIIVEGPLDAWSIGPGGVATLGVGYSPSQVERMSRHPRRYVCFDAEPPAQQRARKLLDELTPLPGETYGIVLDSGKDPAAASKREITQLRRLLQ